MRPSLASPPVLLATWFGAGYLPKAPGTFGSLAALPFAWFIMDQLGALGLSAAIVVVFIIGLWATKGYCDLSGVDDPGPVVIDEVAGQWLTLLIVPLQWEWYLLGFVLFRIFDVFKPWPIGWMDRTIKGPMGVMVDDIAAGVYALIILLGIFWFMENYL